MSGDAGGGGELAPVRHFCPDAKFESIKKLLKRQLVDFPVSARKETVGRFLVPISDDNI